MKAMRWILMLVFTALVLAGVKGGNAKAAGCWMSGNGHDDDYFGMEETGREPATCETDEIIHLRCKGYHLTDPPGQMCDFTRDVVVDGSRLGHDFSEKVKTVAPTCKTQGYTVYKCSRCEKTENRDFVAADGKSHNMQQTFFQPATCEAPGMETLECTVCGHSETKNYPATGHKWEVESRKEATCGEDGYIRYVCVNMLATGQKCGAHKDEKIKATGKHQMETTFFQPATCTDPGVEDRKCKYCEYVDHINYEPTGHTWVADHKDATCAGTGYDQKKCSVCGATKDRTEIKALDHEWEVGVHLDPTCTTAGYDEMICKRCGTEGPRTEIKATGHNWEKVETVPATCQNQGYTIYKCKNCGKTENRDIVPTTGQHNLKESILKQPTCTADGEKQVYCTVCDYNEKVKIPATGHNWKSEVILKQPTCEEPGEEEMICTKCGTEGPRQAIPATGHDWDEGKVTKEAAVYVEGEITYTCKNDPSHTKVEKIPALPDENGNITPPPTGTDGNDPNGQNGNDGQDGKDGKDGKDGTIGNDGQNPDGTIGNSGDPDGNGSGTDKNSQNGSGNGNGSGSGNGKKKSKNIPLILLIILLLLFGLAAVIFLAVRKLRNRD